MNDAHDPTPEAGIEQQIEAALGLLREAAPPAHLEQRVREHLGKSSAQARRMQWPRLWPALATAAGVACFSLLLLHRHPSRLPDEQPAITARTRPDQPTGFPAPALASRTASDSEQRANRSRATSPAGRPLQGVSSNGSMGARKPAVQPAPAAQPLASQPPLEAVDRPAPELPLTAQERLLLRIASGNHPLQMAVNKRVLLPRSVDDTADFDTFFEPYTLPLIEGDPQ